MSASPRNVSFSEDLLIVALNDGREISVPLVYFPRLLRATDAQRMAFELSNTGVHWDEIDEDLSVEGLLAGRPDRTVWPFSVAEFDRYFDDGGDVTPFLDMATAYRPNLATETVAIEIPVALLRQIYVLASAAGLDRRSLLKRWIEECAVDDGKPQVLGSVLKC